MKREAFEEAGVILDEELEEINVIHFIWGEDWARTEKQKKRYELFKGEEMYFFIGKVSKLERPQGDGNESGWNGKQTMKINEAIAMLESFKPFSKWMEQYYSFQLSVLKILEKVLH